MKPLAPVEPFFNQKCPLCGRLNRMVIKGRYEHAGKVELYPDMGYSFCNCKCIFYTKEHDVVDHVPIQIKDGLLTYPDPFFIDWRTPHVFPYFDPRRYHILWDMDGLCQELESKGHKVMSAIRDMDTESKTPMHFHIRVRE